MTDAVVAKSGFQQVQREFAGHVRDPEHCPAPAGIEPRRMQIYRDLVFNNIAGFIRTGFPVLCGLLGAARVDRLVRDFIVCHRAETPYFLEISCEFLAYLQQEYRPEAGDPGYLIELAHYEWVELALDIAATELPDEGVDPDGDLLGGRPVVSPLAWSLSYTYPVHLLGAKFQPTAPPDRPTHLVVYRNRADQVKFLEINVVTARLLQLLLSGSGQSMTGEQALRCVADELKHPDPAVVVATGRATLVELRDLEVILGTTVA